MKHTPFRRKLKHAGPRQPVSMQTAFGPPMHVPIIGITCDFDGKNHQVASAYVAAVTKAGGVPVLLPCVPAIAAQVIECCDGVLFTGGADPIMEQWGEPTHAEASTVHPDRQAFELAMFDLLAVRPEMPVLAVCLGMQFMGLHAGGSLDQHLPESHPEDAAMHQGGRQHHVTGELGSGEVDSRHHQALRDAGSLDVVARSADGIIEAVQDKSRPLYLGVQWHPERTDHAPLGFDLIKQLVDSARAHAQARAVAEANAAR